MPNKDKFHSFMVTPINCVEEGILCGQYDDYSKEITNETVPLKKMEAQKRIYLASYNKRLNARTLPEHLTEDGLKPCVGGINYLLGLMKQLPENEIPKELQDLCFVAQETLLELPINNREKSVLVERFDGLRGLRISSNRSYHGCGWEGCVYLAEEI